MYDLFVQILQLTFVVMVIMLLSCLHNMNSNCSDLVFIVILRPVFVSCLAYWVWVGVGVCVVCE